MTTINQKATSETSVNKVKMTQTNMAWPHAKHYTLFEIPIQHPQSAQFWADYGNNQAKNSHVYLVPIYFSYISTGLRRSGLPENM